MKGIVIYQSRYGAAKQYAEWIGESLNLPVKKTSEINSRELATYDLVIAGSSIYIGKIMMKDWIKRNETVLKNKQLVYFIVGAAPPSDKAKTEKYFTDNISASLLASGQHFYLQGKSIFSELSWLDMFLLKMGARFAKEERLKKEMLTEFNAIRRENLDELLKSLETKI